MSSDTAESRDEPEHAQTRGGSPAPAADREGSAADALRSNVGYLQETTAVYAAVGLGLGLSLLLLDVLGALPVSVSTPFGSPGSETETAHDGVVDGLSFAYLYLMALLVVAVGTLQGFEAPDRFPDDRSAVLPTAVGGILGGIAFTLVAGLLLSIVMPSSGSEFAGAEEEGLSIVEFGVDWVNLLRNGVAFGLAAGVTASAIGFARGRLGGDV